MKTERKGKEGALLFVKAGVYLCKVKPSSKPSLYTDLGLDFLMALFWSQSILERQQTSSTKDM